MTRSTGGTVELERLLRRLADRVPGYPYQLALCARLAGQMEKRMADAANAALKPLQLTYVLYQAMMIICGAEAGSIAPGEIAHLTGEKPNNVTHICNELAERDLITRHPGREDRRCVEVALTASGRRLLAKAQPLIWTKWRQRFAGIGERELAALPELLRRQIDNLDRAMATEPE
jgi:MarR family transcriptional regulator, negative regulator of the multidrug operon emrRAB